MADLNLRINGDASGATQAFAAAGEGAGQLGDDVGKSVIKWQALMDVATQVAKAVVKFGIDSVKAYAESERIQRQLIRASGDYADALDSQAKALSKLYAVDDDVINQSQILLTQWGGVGAATADVEKAALNLAAAFGGDLNSATSDLIRNVESGGTGLAKMGIHFKATGDKGHDLAAAVAAINAKLGGSAEADANSLNGQLRAASIAFDDIKKSIGESISAFLVQHGIVGKLTEALRGMQTALGVGDVAEQNAKNDAYLQLQEHLLANITQRKQLLEGISAMEARGEDSPKSKAMVAHLDANIAKLKEIIQLENAAHGAGDPTAPGVTGKTNKGMKDAAATAATKPGRTDEERLADAKKFYGGIEDLAARAQQQEQDEYAKELEMSGKRVAGDIKEANDRTKVRSDMLLQIEKDNAEHAEKMAKDTARAEEKATKDSIDRAKKQEEHARSVGDQIGAAMVNALSDQLSKLAAGGEFDAALFIGDILAAAAGIAATVIGTYFGAPAIGAAVGNLAAMGIRAGAGAISKGNHKQTQVQYHSGGWVGDEIDVPRHHSGAWIGHDEQRAILQTGERVLSRAEVRDMGGQRGVDSAAKGGAPVYIQAIDAKSMADTFASAGGDGLKQALRRGHGALPGVFARSPR